jgi:hypothetical protein
MKSLARYESGNCRLALDHPSARALLITVSGWDIGEFGDAPLRELEKVLDAGDGVEIFIDAREVKGVSMEVSNGWAQWLKAHRAHLTGVRMLTGSRFTQMTADFVRRYAELSDIMTVHRSSSEFDTALREASKPG